jgi:hypothetical protein
MGEQGVLREPGLIQRAPRVDRLRKLDEGSAALVDRLLRVARTGLPGMQMAEGTACFTRRFSSARVVAEPEGWSLRYTAITVLGIRHLDPAGQRELLAGRTVGEVCDILVDRLPSTDSLGDAALAVWATAACGHDGLDRALDRLDALDAGDGPRYVVDLAWIVSALVAARSAADAEARLTRARSRLLDSLVGTRQLFGHVTGSGLVPLYRSHVGCFADQVYPIQALARLHHSSADPEALAAAERCADRICALQGPGGQWWWHYDARTGEVVEGYPVYSVHQHAMAPMALLDLADAGGRVDLDAIGRGLAWMVAAPETDEPLILDKQGLTVRKVARRDPRKLVRGIRAATTGLRPGLRLGALDRLWPAVALDRECRPYEFGWLLDCWLGGLTAAPPAPPAPRGRTNDGTEG